MDYKRLPNDYQITHKPKPPQWIGTLQEVKYTPEGDPDPRHGNQERTTSLVELDLLVDTTSVHQAQRKLSEWEERTLRNLHEKGSTTRIMFSHQGAALYESQPGVMMTGKQVAAGNINFGQKWTFKRSRKEGSILYTTVVTDNETRDTQTYTDTQLSDKTFDVGGLDNPQTTITAKYFMYVLLLEEGADGHHTFKLRMHECHDFFAKYSKHGVILYATRARVNYNVVCAGIFHHFVTESGKIDFIYMDNLSGTLAPHDDQLDFAIVQRAVARVFTCNGEQLTHLYKHHMDDTLLASLVNGHPDISDCASTLSSRLTYGRLHCGVTCIPLARRVGRRLHHLPTP